MKLIASFLLLVGVVVAEEAPVRGHVFAWPFMEAAEMQPQGGMTKGLEVTLDEEPSKEWTALREKGLEKKERDRRAILAMAGDYRVSFDFVETMGFAKGYKPPKPYFSWGTERVAVLANEPGFVSLQHTLVMYFKGQDGTIEGPMVMKHWRQDWRYEDADLHVYAGRQTWKKKTHPRVKGAWTQAVFQVDDSPRYEVVGRWSHRGGMSTWKSGESWRPLPRREFSVRDDYNVLSGEHEITITANGWVHVQKNRKLMVGEKGALSVVGQELGVNRYERISGPSLAAAGENWEKEGPYWAEVRQKWAEVFRTRESFTLKGEVDGKKLYQLHFGYAGKVREEGFDAEEGKKHARETIDRFLSKEVDPKKSEY
ncbi:MAG: DUF6607 family protein [Verrucomicrobiaceae bacterium]